MMVLVGAWGGFMGQTNGCVMECIVLGRLIDLRADVRSASCLST